jgi:hypothetical protein
MTESISRRHALLSLTVALAAVPAARAATNANSAVKAPAKAATAPAKAAAAPAGGKPHVAKDDPTALALAYFEDAKQVDPKKFPTYKAGQLCENCLQLTGNAGDEWRPCNLFPGKLVHAKGWCKVYVKKP